MASLRAVPLLVLGMALCVLALFHSAASASCYLRRHCASFVFCGIGGGDVWFWGYGTTDKLDVKLRDLQ
ncbi:hypothetical protein [Oryza sativa Japonica Group]|uniref:Uncharacterized protein n=2 Tax=Oryza TaxID=4527 RepID=Q5Z8P9_ORYSJ|nr:hypothetical protein [Oryza sativa Japonica Group]